MPVYEYICARCEAHFDLLRRMSQADAATRCPQCNSEGARRALSRFASFTRGSDGSPAPVSGAGGSCSSCGGGNCASCHH